MKLPSFNNDKERAFVLLLILILLVTTVGFALRFYSESSTRRIGTSFFGADSLESVAITIQPPAGTYEIKNEKNPLEVSMLSMTGCDIWYTKDGSNPMGWRVLNMNNPNLKHYSGHSILLTESTVFKVVGKTIFSSFTP
ncbi:MAG: hypothetical protein KAR20_05415, partial [Candidatus Heimdallarchaeota archaeon]|nr:hypothetical protein [Candidatus Heimdallarchaeota archaeon]